MQMIEDDLVVIGIAPAVTTSTLFWRHILPLTALARRQRVVVIVALLTTVVVSLCRV